MELMYDNLLKDMQMGLENFEVLTNTYLRTVLKVQEYHFRSRVRYPWTFIYWRFPNLKHLS